MTVSAESTRPRTSIRVRAALAAGLVMGVAAGMTVASWTDAEFVSGQFTASSFGIEVNVNGAGYSHGDADHGQRGWGVSGQFGAGLSARTGANHAEFDCWHGLT